MWGWYDLDNVLSSSSVKREIWTRKSSCVNARGIPTAAYQVLHMLSCPGGIPQVPPTWGTPLRNPPSWPIWGGGVPHPHPDLPWVSPAWDTPCPDLAGRYPRYPPTWGTPCPDLAGGYPPEVSPILTWPGGTLGTPTPPGVPPSWPTPTWGTPILTWLGYPPPWLDLAGVTPPPSWTWLG